MEDSNLRSLDEEFEEPNSISSDFLILAFSVLIFSARQRVDYKSMF
jgi:hypothetical protein